MVNCGAILSGNRVYHVTTHMSRKGKSVPTKNASVRATISFPPDLHKTLEEIAQEKKVSLAWVVRDAAEQYVKRKWVAFKERS